MRNKILRWIVHTTFPVKKAQYRDLKKFARNIHNKKILEIGSGRYDLEHFFHRSNTFIKSDIDLKYGHRIIDITKLGETNEYDVILCLNVLEHVYDYRIAIDNIYNALKSNGILFLSVPFFYPLHDEPNDYWRFTEHSFRKLLINFSDISIKKSGLRTFPYNYSIICKKV